MTYFKTTTLIVSLAMLLGLTACNTVEGAGRDLQTAGQGVQDAAIDHKD